MCVLFQFTLLYLNTLNSDAYIVVLQIKYNAPVNDIVAMMINLIEINSSDCGDEEVIDDSTGWVGSC